MLTGIEKAKAEKKFEGRKEDVKRNAKIAALLESGDPPLAAIMSGRGRGLKSRSIGRRTRIC